MRASPRISVLVGGRTTDPHPPIRPGNGLGEGGAGARLPPGCQGDDGAGARESGDEGRGREGRSCP